MHGKGAVVKNRPASAGDLRDMVQSLGQEDPLDKEMATHSVFLPGKFNGQRSPGRLQSMGLRRIGHN